MKYRSARRLIPVKTANEVLDPVMILIVTTINCAEMRVLNRHSLAQLFLLKSELNKKFLRLLLECIRF